MASPSGTTEKGGARRLQRPIEGLLWLNTVIVTWIVSPVGLLRCHRDDGGAVNHELAALGLDFDRLAVQCFSRLELDDIGGFTSPAYHVYR